MYFIFLFTGDGRCRHEELPQDEQLGSNDDEYFHIKKGLPSISLRP